MKEALTRLWDKGHVALLVGGCVRDHLLGVAIKDYDIATSASPDETCALFPRAVTVGKAFGVIKVPTLDSDREIEIATFRKDLDYVDHRHPRKVQFGDPAEDASRRDFTVNALFLDVKAGRILDYTSGLEDLKAKVLRAIGNPSERFREDALRLLRAVRFSVRLGFELERETAAAVKARARLVSHVSQERIRDELTLMIQGPRPDRALALLSELNLLVHVLPEVEQSHGIPQSPLYGRGGDLWEHKLRFLQELDRLYPRRSQSLAWAALIHDVGRPLVSRKNKGMNFNGFEIEGEKLARRICERMKLSTEQLERIAGLVADQLKIRHVFEMREATLVRFLREDHFEDLLALHRVDALCSDGNLAFYEFCMGRLDSMRKQPQIDPKLVDGKDLIQLGFSPGPEFSRILRVLEDLAIEGALQSKEQALEYVVKHFVR